MISMATQVPSGGNPLLRRAGPAAAGLVLASVYVEHLLQLHTPSVLGLDLSDPARVGEALAWYAIAAAAAALFAAPALALLGARRSGRVPDAETLVGAAAGAWRLWLAGLAYAVGTTLGALLLLLPGLFLSIAWVLYGPAAVLAGAGPVRALALSYRRVRRGWTRVVALIAGPFICYGIVYVIGVVPALHAALGYAYGAASAGHAVSQTGLTHVISTYAPPFWFRWGVMPVLYASARLYLFAAVVAAWQELAES